MKRNYWFSIISCLLFAQVLFSMEVEVNTTGRCHPIDFPFQVRSIIELKNYVKKNADFLDNIASIDIFERGEKYFVDIRCKPFLASIKVEAQSIVQQEILNHFSIDKGSFFDRQKIDNAIKKLKHYLMEKGYFKPRISYELQGKDSSNLILRVSTNPLVKLDHIIVVSSMSHKLFDYSLLDLNFKNKIASKAVLEQIDVFIRKKIKNEGVFYFQLKREKLQLIGNKATLRYSLSLGPKIGLSIITKNDLIQTKVRQFLLHTYFQEGREPHQAELVKGIRQFLEKMGFFYAQINTRIVKGKTKTGYPMYSIFLRIKSARHIRISDISFVGISTTVSKTLTNLFWQQGSELIKGQYFDRKYVQDFSGFIKKFFLRRGILYNKVSTPFLDFSSAGDVSIRYDIEEGEQFTLKEFSIIPKIGKRDLAALNLHNYINHPFNPIDLKEDLQAILKYFLDQGFYFAKYHSLRSDDIVHYDYDANTVKIFLKLDNMVKCRINNIFIVGNKKTKRWVIRKMLNIPHDQLLTPALVSDIKNRLLKSGIFSSVDIKLLYEETVGNDDYYRLFIRVKERKSGRITNSLGYRTDLGIKAESRLFYGNLFGSAKNISAKIRVNRRVNGGVELIRENIPNNLWEYNTSVSFQDPFLLQSFFQIKTTLATSRERFYRFDADITRASIGIRRDFKKYFSFILNYQLEKVRQYNADDSINEVAFNVGSLSPHFIFDYRDSAVRPARGGKFDLICELANPTLLSMDTSDLTINYYKVIVRNVVYFPTSFGTVALMIAGGMEKNLANQVRTVDGSPTYWENGQERTQGYIPSIKVFRLEGGYNIRGFSFDESNYLISGEDISTKIVQDRAFFTLIKIEPRYFYSDNIVLSAFFDAGRVFYNNFLPLDLRASVGFSFKYVTPVGTIDLDYGIKLHRYTHDDTGREGFGRLHFSIGLF